MATWLRDERRHSTDANAFGLATVVRAVLEASDCVLGGLWVANARGAGRDDGRTCCVRSMSARLSKI